MALRHKDFWSRAPTIPHTRRVTLNQSLCLLGLSILFPNDGIVLCDLGIPE